MSLTSYEELGRVGRVGRGCKRLVRSKSCVSGSRTVENDTDTRTKGQHYTTADRRLTNQISAWQAGRGSRRTRTTCCGHPREDDTGKLMLRGKMVPWNLSFTARHFL